MRLIFTLLFVLGGVQLNAEDIKLDCKSTTNSDQHSYEIDLENNLIHASHFLVNPRPIKVFNGYITWIPRAGNFVINSSSVLERKSLLLIITYTTEWAFKEKFGEELVGPYTYIFQCIRGI